MGQGGVCGVGFFPAASTEKMHCMFSYTQKKVPLNTCLQELGIYLKDQRKLVSLDSGVKENVITTSLLILSIMDTFASFLSWALHFTGKQDGDLWDLIGTSFHSLRREMNS